MKDAAKTAKVAGGAPASDYYNLTGGEDGEEIEELDDLTVGELAKDQEYTSDEDDGLSPGEEEEVAYMMAAAAAAAAAALNEDTLAAPEDTPGDEDPVVDGMVVDEELAAMPADGEQGEELQAEVGVGAAVAQPAVPADAEAQGEEGGASGSNENRSRCVLIFIILYPVCSPST